MTDAFWPSDDAISTTSAGMSSRFLIMMMSPTLTFFEAMGVPVSVALEIFVLGRVFSA